MDLIYLCFPNNPTGAVATREQLKVWVDYANANGAVILYDSAYEAFITEEDVPTPSLRSRGPAPVPLSSAPTPRPPASPATAAPTPWCPWS